MGIFGNSKMKLFAGSQKVKKAYLGTEKIYSAGSIVTYYVDSNTYYQEEVDSDASCLNPTTFTPSKSGWTFVGWREDTTANGNVLSSKIMGDEPISLYAVFSKPVTVYTYDNNGGEPCTQEGTAYYNNGNTLGASIEAYGCDAAYNNFRGYAKFDSIDEIDANIYPSYTPDVYEYDELDVTDDIYLVALYSETITLTYYNNSTTKSTTTGTKYIEMYNYESEDPKFTLSQASKSGWTARGWATGTAGNASVAYSSINNTRFSSNKTLYGLYYKTCTLTAKSYNSTKTASGTAYYNSAGNTTNATCTVPTAASYSGWSRRGWSTSTVASARVEYSNNATYILGISDATIYGLYSQTIYLYYNGNGSTSGSVSTQSGTRYYNAYGNTSNPSFTLASNGYSRTGHNFNGWDLGAVGATITLSSSKTAYAQWTAINYYFDINGADNGLVDVYINGSLVASGVSDYYQQHPYGSTYEIKNIRPKSGYNYDGVTGGSLSGTITGATTVTLSFSITTIYAFQNGSLGSGISVSGASVSGGKITAGVGSNAWTDWEGEHEAEEADIVVTISGLDLTNYSKLYISSTAYRVNAYGDAYCTVGIDTPHTYNFITDANGEGQNVNSTITIDVSGYTGVHSLQFYLYAYSHSSYTGYHSAVNLGITEIKLYN